MYVSDDEWKGFVQKCRELGLPEDARMDDFLEFLEAFTSVVREGAEDDVREQIHYDVNHRHEPEPTDAEREERVTDLTHERLRKLGGKLAKLLEGI